MKKLLGVFLLLAVVLPAEEIMHQVEEPKKADKVFMLDEVVVTGTRVEKTLKESPGSLELVSGEKLTDGVAKNAGEAIPLLPGVDLGRNGALGQTQNLLMRGVSSEGTLILLDGVPLNGSYSGLVDFTSLPLDNLERIEVLKGPASALYGANAVGGVVNLITKTKAYAKPEFSLSGNYGTYNTQDFRGGASFSLDKLAVNLSGQYQYTDGARENSSYKAADASGNLVYNFDSKNSVKLGGGYQKDRIGAPGSVGFPTPADYQLDSRLYGNLESRTALSDDMYMKIKFYGNRKTMDFYSFSNTLSTEQNYSADAQYVYDIAGLNVITLGATYKYDIVDQNSIGNKTASTRSVYFQDVFDLLGSWIVTPSIRYDSHTIYGDSLNPQFSLVYNLDDNLQFKGSVGSSFRAPNFSELYWPVDNIFFTQGNAALVPEKAFSFDAGLSYQLSDALYIKTTYFQNNIRDMIQWALDPVSFYFMPMNVGNARTLGVESEIKLRPVEGVSFYANHTWLSALDTDKNKDLYYRPKNKVNVGFEVKACIFRLNLDSEYYDIRTGVDAVSWLDVTLPSVIVSSAKLSVKVCEYSDIIVSVNNLEDVKYELRSGYPMPGRNVSGGVNLKF